MNTQEVPGRNGPPADADNPITSDAHILKLSYNEFISRLRKIGLFIHDLESGKVYPNDLWYEWGYSDADLNSHHFLTFIHPDDQQRVKNMLSELKLHDDSDASVVFRIRNAAGQWRWVYAAYFVVLRESDRKMQQFIGFEFDLTAQMSARESAEQIAQEAETLASAAAIINANLDIQSTVSAILEQANKVMSFYSASVQLLREGYVEIVGGTGFTEDLKVIGMRFPIPGDNPNTAVIQHQEPLILDPEAMRSFNGLHLKVDKEVRNWMGIPLVSKGGVVGMITFDRTESRRFSEHELQLGQNFANHVAIALRNAQLYEEMRHLSIRDALTGCYNRRWMFDQLDQQMDVAIRYGHSLSLIMFDLDNFKMINDRYGHLFGDRALKTVTDITRDLLRKSDFLCRYGGEEFTIILSHTDEEDAWEIGERIRQAVANHEWYSGSDEALTLSLGCTVMQHSDVRQVEAFITRADTALMSAKQSGKNRCVKFSSLFS